MGRRHSRCPRAVARTVPVLPLPPAGGKHSGTGLCQAGFETRPCLMGVDGTGVPQERGVSPLFCQLLPLVPLTQ